MMKKLCEAAKVKPQKVFPHNLRHLFARLYYSMEKDIVRLADILGHSNINTTRIYTRESCEKHREILNLPKYVFPTAMLVFGYPTQQQKERQKPQRVDMKHVVHENAYRHMDADELKEMFSIKAVEKSYEDWMKAFCSRKFNSDFSREMSRSVSVYAQDFLSKEE